MDGRTRLEESQPAKRIVLIQFEKIRKIRKKKKKERAGNSFVDFERRRRDKFYQ